MADEGIVFIGAGLCCLCWRSLFDFFTMETSPFWGKGGRVGL